MNLKNVFAIFVRQKKKKAAEFRKSPLCLSSCRAHKMKRPASKKHALMTMHDKHKTDTVTLQRGAERDGQTRSFVSVRPFLWPRSGVYP